ncbi:type I polyketide synthase [Venturia nashicola]|uniref:Type I polyketide synthase n=1 Tax=Venturia nashicola TaxID=86259 RepID=A0A4Z1PKN0_9PEZI|nr:type I polyketide synthase [Venturia nashicola]
MTQITSIADLLKRHANIRPKQVAFSGPAGYSITYGDLAIRTERIAVRLLSRGVTRGQRVATAQRVDYSRCVADVVVVGVPHFMLGEVPVAIIVPRPKVDVDLTMLLAACRAVLPDYKVPSTFYTVEAIPHTASGKPSRLKAKQLLGQKGHYQPLSAHLLGEDLVEPLVLVEIIAVCGIDVGSKHLDRFGHGSGKGDEAEAHLDIGASPSVAAGRISYTFDLKGPSMALNAACSSSLTAIHLAAQSLQTRESGLAIAGGVTLMSTPRQFIAFSRQRGLASNSRCRLYSADAASTGCLVRGSAVNNNGSSAGLTVPSGYAQQEVIRQTLGRASLSPGAVDVLDGHGTSTSLGDPIELRAIHQNYGNRSGSAPLLLGSVKSNIGHTQAVAGIASVIKMIKGMQYGIAPASINVSEPSPHVDWTSGALELLTQNRPWPKAPKLRPRRAAVSSFGISGTNTHVILEHVELLSGADEAALRAQAHAVSRLCHTKSASDVAFSLITTRAAYSHRASVAASGDELYQALTDLDRIGKNDGRLRLEVAMFRLMEYFGFCPDYVVGHSLGEVAAAHAAGVLSLADAATLVTARGTLVAALPDGGSLVSVSASADDVNEVLQDPNVEASTVVAAVNDHTSA